MSFAKTLNIQVDVQVASPTCAPPQPLRSSNYPAKWWDIEENQSVSIVLIQSWLSRKQNTQTTYILAAATRSRQVRLSSVIRCEVGQKSVGLILARNTVCCTSTNVSYYRRSIVVQKGRQISRKPRGCDHCPRNIYTPRLQRFCPSLSLTCNTPPLSRNRDKT